MDGTSYEYGFDLEQWVIKTRRAQGLPDHIEDPVALAKIADLLCGDVPLVGEREGDRNQDEVPEDRQ